MTSEPAVQPVNAERDHAAAMYAYTALGKLLQLPFGLERMAPEDVMRVLLEQTYRGIHVCAVMAAIMNGAEVPERPDHDEWIGRYVTEWRRVVDSGGAAPSRAWMLADEASR